MLFVGMGNGVWVEEEVGVCGRVAGEGGWQGWNTGFTVYVMDPVLLVS